MLENAIDERYRFINEIRNDLDPGWSDDPSEMILIKGKIVVPKAIEKVTKYEVE